MVSGRATQALPLISPIFSAIQTKKSTQQALLYKTLQQLPGGFQSKLGLCVRHGYLLLQPEAPPREDTQHLQMGDSAEMKSMLPKSIFPEDDGLKIQALGTHKINCLLFPWVPHLPGSSPAPKSLTPPKYSSQHRATKQAPLSSLWFLWSFH